LFGVFFAGSIILFPNRAYTHCDTLDGPVITDAKAALEKGDVTAVLKWVSQKDEEEIRGVFAKTLVVRKLSSEAKELADMYFFETLVRVHRAGEGAAYTGLKPSTDTSPSVIAADKAIESGSVDSLAARVSHLVSAGIIERFERVMEAKKHINESVEAGREYVKAYIEFVHYVESIHQAASGESPHQGHEHKNADAEDSGM
jgi:hypothetical protein